MNDKYPGAKSSSLRKKYKENFWQRSTVRNNGDEERKKAVDRM